MVLNIIKALVTAAAGVLCSWQFLHMLQLESYQMPGYKRYLRTHVEVWRGIAVYAGIGCTLGYYLLKVLFTAVSRGDTTAAAADVVCMLAAAGAALMNEWQHRKTPQKKPFAVTKRMRRLICALCVIDLVLAALLVLAHIPPYVLLCASPLTPALALTVMQPYENHVNMGFFRQAQAKLDSLDGLIRIGITGSFGKTSTKNVLATILREKYNVFHSPRSFNTPMGLCTVINNDLKPEHQVFIAEMGARHKGDIKELVDLVHPTYGLLTSVGPQHLETFGDLETVARTKYELIEGLGSDGHAFFVSDDGIVDSLFDKCTCDKVLTNSPDAEHGCYAKDVLVSSAGSSFTMVLDGRELHVVTRLLGRHNIRNICLAAACAAKLGLTDAQIIRGIAKIAQIEHRMQILPGDGTVTIIDDAFNSNSVGAEEALRILNGFDGSHIVVTPGFVEGGDLEETMNRELGNQIAKYCDVAILVGKKHTQPILQGVLEGGMAKDCVFSVANLTEAQAILSYCAQPGDTVLFENDLPDNYNE